MKKYMFSLILLLQLFTSCNGQKKMEQVKETTVKELSLQAKIQN